MNQQPRWSVILKKALIFTLWSLPALCAFHAMWTHWVAVPFWDEWDTPGGQLASYYRGTLNFAELFSQHNEHRLFFPRLVWLPIAILAGWDVRYEMVLTFCFVCLGSAGLYQLLRFSGGPPAPRALVFGVMNLLLFSPREYETFLVGAQGQTFVPTFALVFALWMNLSGRSLPTKTIVNAALAFVGTYSFGNGMLLWVLAFPVDMQPAAGLPATRPRARIFWRVAYLLIAAVSIASYFISYRHPPLSPPVVSPLAQFPAFVRFVVVWIGSLFSVSAPTTCGGIALLLFIGLTTAAILQMRRTGTWQPHYPWLLLACYTVISAGIAAIARLGFDYSMAGDSRYTAFSTFFYIALGGLAYTVYAQARPRSLGARMAWPVAIVFLLLILVLWLSTYKRERKFLRADRQLRKHTQLVVRWIDAIPQNPEMAFSYPHHQEKTVDTIRTIAARGGLRPRFVSHALASAVQNPPQAIDASAGILEQATLQRGRQVFCKGWARIPEQDRPANCVVLGFETNKNRWRLYCVLETGENRPDAAGPTGNASLARAGFSRTVDARSLPQTGATMRAWAIDLRNERAFPMAGAISLPAEP
ncbi:MAG TPA: hypothetical protein VK581_10955 [Chthoniobacterales bacterium]|nr:hypothetical protein [Chthoniobacterales bacterium]